MTSAVNKSDFCFAAMLCLYSKNIAAEVEEALVSAFDRQSYPPSQLIVVYDGPIPDGCLLYTSPSPRDLSTSRMPSSA